MRRLLLLLLAFACLPTFAAETAAPSSLAPGLVNPGYEEQPAWFKNSFLDLRDDVAEATHAGHRVLLYFYQDGCPYCARLIRTNFADRQISDYAKAHFDVIAVNLWGDREVTGLDGTRMSEKAFAKSLHVQFTPTLLFLGEEGQPLLRINGYYPPPKFLAALRYVGERQERGGSFADYYAQLAPVAVTGHLHQEPGFLHPPYVLARRPGGKPLLVMFEQPECRICDQYHLDFLQRPESRALLGRFDVALLDVHSSQPLMAPDGHQLSAREWAHALGVQFTPTLVFFDASGHEVFRTEAYLRPFHLQSAMEYVASGAYRQQPEFQRYVQSRADALREQGQTVDIWE